MWDHDTWGRPLRRREDLEEPEWDPNERVLMLALGYIEERECSGCGGWLPETTDSDSDSDNPEAHWMYHVDNPVRCHRCTAIARRREGYKDAEQDHALSFPASRVPRGRVRLRLIPLARLSEIGAATPT